MQTVLPSEFKRGLVVMLDDAPHVVEEFHVSGTAQTRHKLHVRLRHLLRGHFVTRQFAESERIPVADLVTRPVQFSYQQGDTSIFTDTETYEELQVSADQLGERRWFLRDNDECRAQFLDGKLLDIVLPPSVSLRIVETAPPIRGASDSSWKPAKLETGLEIMVPLFLNKGDLVRVDTETRKYGGKDTTTA